MLLRFSMRNYDCLNYVRPQFCYPWRNRQAPIINFACFLMLVKKKRSNFILNNSLVKILKMFILIGFEIEYRIFMGLSNLRMFYFHKITLFKYGIFCVLWTCIKVIVNFQSRFQITLGLSKYFANFEYLILRNFHLQMGLFNIYILDMFVVLNELFGHYVTLNEVE